MTVTKNYKLESEIKLKIKRVYNTKFENQR